MQLAGCLLLFLTVFFAKGTGGFGRLRLELSQLLQTNTDFKSAFSNLGWSVAAGRPAGKILSDFCVDVFVPQKTSQPLELQDGPLYQEAAQVFSPAGVSLTAKVFSLPQPTEPEKHLPPEEEPPSPAPETEPAVVHVDYDGPALPDNATMDRYTLGLSETVSPVMAVLSSPFGWREHPISGGEKFHCGVDLAVDSGTDVVAFADGTVDYIGESDVYGMYLQLRHDNGVTSFYAHCSKLCVQQGQRVSMGEKVAESGATGEVTGPHLHFEMKKDGIRLNPAYYIETLA